MEYRWQSGLKPGKRSPAPKSAGVYVFMMIFAMCWSDINIINIFNLGAFQWWKAEQIMNVASTICVNDLVCHVSGQWHSVTIGKHMLVFACARSSLAIAGSDSWWLASAYLFGTLRIFQKSNASKSTQTRSLFFLPFFKILNGFDTGSHAFRLSAGSTLSLHALTCLLWFSSDVRRGSRHVESGLNEPSQPFFLSRCFCFFPFPMLIYTVQNTVKWSAPPKNKAYAAYVDIRFGHVLIYKVARLELDLFALSTFSNLHQQKESLSFLFANLLAGFRKANSA